MSGKFSPRNETGNPLGNDRGSSTRLLLLVLLLLVAAAGYLYFFTDYIIPHKETVSAPPQPVQVKQPLPPRPGQTEAAKPGQVPPASPAAAAPQAKTVPLPAQAKGQPAQKPAPPPAKPEPAKPVHAGAPAKPAAPAAAAPKPAAKQVAAPAKAGEKTGKQAGKQAVTKVVKEAVKKKGGSFRLLVGDFGPDKTLASVQAKLKKCGISPVRKSVVTAAEPMNRIFVARFTDQDAAEAELGKVKKITGDAFLIADNGGYSVYAGSYLSAGRAAAERKKLDSRGVKSAIRKVKVKVRVTRVTAGSYGSSEDARKDAALLKKQGIRATVIKMK